MSKINPVEAILQRYKKLRKGEIVTQVGDWFNAVGLDEFNKAVKSGLIQETKNNQWELSNKKKASVVKAAEQMLVEKEEEGKWITSKGQHIFIPNGRDTGEVLKEHFDKMLSPEKNPKTQNESELTPESKNTEHPEEMKQIIKEMDLDKERIDEVAEWYLEQEEDEYKDEDDEGGRLAPHAEDKPVIEHDDKSAIDYMTKNGTLEKFNQAVNDGDYIVSDKLFLDSIKDHEDYKAFKEMEEDVQGYNIALEKRALESLHYHRFTDLNELNSYLRDSPTFGVSTYSTGKGTDYKCLSVEAQSQFFGDKEIMVSYPAEVIRGKNAPNTVRYTQFPRSDWNTTERSDKNSKNSKFSSETEVRINGKTKIPIGSMYIRFNIEMDHIDQAEFEERYGHLGLLEFPHVLERFDDDDEDEDDDGDSNRASTIVALTSAQQTTEEDGSWITSNGQHIFIPNGQDKGEVLKEHFDKLENKPKSKAKPRSKKNTGNPNIVIDKKAKDKKKVDVMVNTIESIQDNFPDVKVNIKKTSGVNKKGEFNLKSKEVTLYTDSIHVDAIPSTIIHEFGHAKYEELPDEQMETWAKAALELPRISKYAGMYQRETANAIDIYEESKESTDKFEQKLKDKGLEDVNNNIPRGRKMEEELKERIKPMLKQFGSEYHSELQTIVNGHPNAEVVNVTPEDLETIKSKFKDTTGYNIDDKEYTKIKKASSIIALAASNQKEGEDGNWITSNGHHIFIKNGKDKGDAVREHFENLNDNSKSSTPKSEPRSPQKFSKESTHILHDASWNANIYYFDASDAGEFESLNTKFDEFNPKPLGLLYSNSPVDVVLKSKNITMQLSDMKKYESILKEALKQSKTMREANKKVQAGNKIIKDQLEKTKTVYRGIDLKEFVSMAKNDGSIGEHERDKYGAEQDFISTSVDRGVADSFANSNNLPMTLEFDVSNIQDLEINPLEYSLRNDIKIEGENGYRYRPYEKFGGTHPATFQNEAEVQLKNKAKPIIREISVSKSIISGDSLKTFEDALEKLEKTQKQKIKVNYNENQITSMSASKDDDARLEKAIKNLKKLHPEMSRQSLIDEIHRWS